MRALILLTATLVVLSWNKVFAQDHHSADNHSSTDTTQIHSIREVFSKGIIHGHVRNYFMATWNHKELSDYHANAIGAEIGYKTADFHGFHLGITGLFTYNVFSSDLEEVDHLSNKRARWETELFDLEDPGNKHDLDRLDELYLEYKSKRFSSRIGRFSFTSPLINPQDGRMKPYSVQGISAQIPIKKSLITLAFFDHFSPRSTVEWFKADESIGVYSMGVNQHGEPAAYHHHTNTKGVALVGLQMQPAKYIKAEAWNYWIENIANTTYSRAIIDLIPEFKIGIEGLYQFQVGNGGNPDSHYTYFHNQQQWLAEGMLAYERKKWHFSANYLHVGNGMFLFPREWGREQFFVTLPRGRMEGLGKSDIFVLKTRHRWSDELSTEVALAKTWLPSRTNYEYNKYGAVSYLGWTADINYSPANPFLKGLSFRLLYLGRYSADTAIPVSAMFYNTNFHHLNFVTQLSF